MTYFIKTFGCAMNISDSERVSAFLEKQGLREAGKIEKVDLVVFNTCGVRQAAENRVYSLINNLHKVGNLEPRTSNLKPIIILTGCLANRSDVQKRLKGKVDLFFPISRFEEFENFIIKHSFEIQNLKFEILAQNNSVPNKEGTAYLSNKPKYTNSYQAFVPIMTGCNNFCSYCVVPYARGREVSRPADEIVAEVKELVAKNCKLITLLGQNVNSYKSPPTLSPSPSGRGCPALSVRKGWAGEGNVVDFAKLLTKINALPGKFWITFVSSHPKDMDDELIETIAKCKKVCEWIHLPVQAGDDEILKKMNRKYTRAHYLKIIRKIKKTFAQIRGPLVPISVSTDIIVGFPGETKKQFLQSADIMEKAKFDMAYFGQFSPRPGTAAWNMKDNVSKKEKERREFVLNEILKKTALANNKKYVGKIIEVLIESEARPKGNLKDSLRLPLENYAYFGKTRTMKNIKIVSKKKIPVGSFVKAKVTKANIWNLESTVEK